MCKDCSCQCSSIHGKPVCAAVVMRGADASVNSVQLVSFPFFDRMVYEDDAWVRRVFGGINALVGEVGLVKSGVVVVGCFFHEDTREEEFFTVEIDREFPSEFVADSLQGFPDVFLFAAEGLVKFLSSCFCDDQEWKRFIHYMFLNFKVGWVSGDGHALVNYFEEMQFLVHSRYMAFCDENSGEYV